MLAITILLAGLLGSLLLANANRKRHEMESMRVFTAESSAMRNAVARQVELYFTVLDSIGKLHDLSDRISAEDFEEFTSKGMQFQRGILGAYGFVQRVSHSLRIAIDAEGIDELHILEPGPAGDYIPAETRSEYFPLVYQNPENALGVPLGADFAALPGMADLITSMFREKSPVINGSLRLQSTPDQFGHFVCSPLYQRDESGREFLSGFTVSIFWPQQILDRALSDIAPNDVLIRFFNPAFHHDTSHEFSEKFEVTGEIELAGTSWRFQTRASREYLEARQTILPGVILFSGASVTILLATILWQLAGRTRRIERVVAERTRDLQSANEKLSEAMRERMRLEHEILDISEREKQMVGQDLHDSLGQKLTGAVFLSRALVAHAQGKDEDLREQASRINEILKESVSQVRRMARGLSPVELGDEGLAGALNRLAEETSSVYGITCIYHQGGNAPNVPPNKAHHLYAIALESITNAVRHGKSREIVIEFSRHENTGRLSIEDDGDGFNPTSTLRGGMGLRIMKYRATMIDGHLEITRRPSGGMDVTCSFPVGVTGT